MRFAHPWSLLLLLAVPVLGWLRRRWLHRTAVPFAPLQLDPGPPHRRRLLAVEQGLFLAVIALLIAAAAGPVRVEPLDLVEEKGLDIALVLDISASMQAADFEPSRLEALKRVATELVRRGGTHRWAVYAFAGRVFTQTPLTTDRASVVELIGSLDFRSIDHAESGGTALGDALLLATEDLTRQRRPGRDQVIVAISDGESGTGIDPVLAARNLRERGIHLEVIGIGGLEPVPVLIDGKPFINTANKPLETQLDDTQLKEIARAGGGRYRRAVDGPVLESIFEEIGRLHAAPLATERLDVERSLVPGMAVGGLIFGGMWLLLAGLVLGRPWR